MNISLRWLYDHLEGDWAACNVEHLVARFNTTSAEIEHHARIVWDMRFYVFAEVAAYSSTTIDLWIPEFEVSYTLPRAQWGEQLAFPPGEVGYLMKSDTPLVAGDTDRAATAQYRRATLRDFGFEKEGLVPPCALPEASVMGDWRTVFEAEDVIFEIDNKSITHRPDMWGHRGFAREIGAMLGIQLRPESQFLAVVPRVTVPQGRCAGTFAIDNQAPDACGALAGLWLQQVAPLPCDVRMLSRFLKIGYRPLNALVDITNYVMADWGHPMHAYDADKIAGREITVRYAAPGESLVLLDGTVKQLVSEDLVVADHHKVLGLAGIMGGMHDSISEGTKEVFLEAGVFHAATVRRTALRHKVRTESSQRFEKTLDPLAVPAVISRFLAVAQRCRFMYECPEPMLLSLRSPEPLELSFTHAVLESRMGIIISADRVISILEHLSFGVARALFDGAPGYVVTVPSFRSTKDVTRVEDIFEEVVRSYGFERCIPLLPPLTSNAVKLRPLMRKRAVKQHLAIGCRMREQQNYAYANEDFLKLLGWQEEPVLVIQNPVSSSHCRMITSLIPGLLENCLHNSAEHERFAFFEWNRIWPELDREEHALAAVWFKRRGDSSVRAQRGDSDFFELKAIVEEVAGFFQAALSWESLSLQVQQGTHGERSEMTVGDMSTVGRVPRWATPGEGAEIRLAETGAVVGVLARVQHQYASAVGILPEGSVWAMELSIDVLSAVPHRVPKVVPLKLYPDSTFDLSVMVPGAVTVAQCEAALRGVSQLVRSVELVDLFEKKEWGAARSITFRSAVGSDQRTLVSDEIEDVRRAAIAELEALGCSLRQ